MTDREAMKQALEALELLSQQPIEMALDYADNAITALRERLAQPEQDAVLAEREACIDLVAFYGGPVDLEAAIRARGNT